MKVLLLTQYFWPETFLINRLVRALIQSDVEISVLTGKPNYPDGIIFSGYHACGIVRESYEGVGVTRVPLFPRSRGSLLGLVLNYLSFVLSASLLSPFLLRADKFDAIFVYAPSPILQAIPAIFLGKLRNVPVALWVQDLWPESLSATGFVRSPAILAIVERLVRWIYKNCDMILIQSEAFREPVARLAGAQASIKYFPNPIDCSNVQPGQPSVEALAIATKMKLGFSVLFTGNLGSAQSLDTVLDAAARLSGANIGIFLVGTGNQFDHLSSRVANLGLKNVFLPGRLPATDMAFLFQHASVLLASLRDDPAFARTIPSKIQAYLAAGKPIIAAMNGEGARVVEEAQAGISCRADDPEQLADAILKMSQLGDQVRLDYGSNARQYACANFSLEKLAVHLAQELECLSTNYRKSKQ